ncbi:MAG: hydantoinase/oxoprolinase N-terminal domain-containing protein [Suipraeoptans sp.]
MESVNCKEEKGIIGIDAGGTFTDLIFLNSEDGTVQAKAKTPTHHDNLIKTIENGLDILLKNINVAMVSSFNLATTLATNAIVENRLRPVALIAIGYDVMLIEKAEKDATFNTEYIYTVRGGHQQSGDEKEALDEEALEKVIKELPEAVEGIAVSSYFSVRNTAHENRAVEIIHALRPDIYVSCGHELSTDLDAIKRATTTTLNAGLIPIVMGLINSVERVCNERNINVPITIVRGDGTIVGAPWAKEHPVEMILSGPAGSACGARYLAIRNAISERESWVVDIGGTTTDIIRLDAKGKPVLLDEGATVANHKTLVKTIDIYTFGLGGDTRILKNSDGSLELDRRRVKSLCSLAEEWPMVIDELKQLVKRKYQGEPLFLVKGAGVAENEFETKIMQNLANGPKSRALLLAGENALWIKYRYLDSMEERGLVQYSSFTPTDALHVLNQLNLWSKEASVLAASLMINSFLKTTALVATWVKDMVEKTIEKTIILKNLSVDGVSLTTGDEGHKLIDEMIFGENRISQQLNFNLAGSLVGVGAPTWAFLPKVGKVCHETALLPENAEVAGAVGAAVGSFALVYSVRIAPVKGSGLYRVHYPIGIKDFEELEDAVDFANQFMERWLTERAEKAGANNPMIESSREDKTALISLNGNAIYLYTELTYDVSDN